MAGVTRSHKAIPAARNFWPDLQLLGMDPLTTAINYNKNCVLEPSSKRQQTYGHFPRQSGRNLLPIIARYADKEAMSLFMASEHICQRCDRVYCQGSFVKHFRERFDADGKLMLTFRDLVKVIGSEPCIQDLIQVSDSITKSTQAEQKVDPSYELSGTDHENDNFLEASEIPLVS